MYPRAIVSGCWTRGAHADDSRIVRGELASADTAIAVEAGEHVPRLITLKAPGATVWKNRADEILPEQVAVHGAAQPLVWRLDRSASRFESKQIQLVYVTDSPRMRLEWQWRARAGHGPIEHTIMIQNLSDESVWLPLLPSFRFDWEVDPNSALERFWVEKGADAPSSEGTHLDVLHDVDGWQGSSSTYEIPTPNQPREMIPYLMVRLVCRHRVERSHANHTAASRHFTARRGGSQSRPGPLSDPPPARRHFCNADDFHRRVRRRAGWRRQNRTALGASRAQ
jgi:hypothetical protein